jgi:hypothetical protein
MGEKGEVDLMEEIDQPKGSILRSARERVARLLFPGMAEALDNYSNLALRLQHVTQQRDKLTQDVGLYKGQWAYLAVGDMNPGLIAFSEYTKMLNDAQVRAGFDLIVMGVLMKPWKIRHPDKEVVETLTRNLESLIYPSFRGAMKGMLSAVAYGFSVTEIVFEENRGKWLVRTSNGLKTLNPEYIKFFSDPFGNLKKIEENIGGSSVDLPIDRMLIWSHNSQFGNWYGESLLNACYKNWFIKDAMLKFANIGYERFGSPILLGIAPTPGDMDNVLETIEHLYARSQGVLLKRHDKDPTAIEVIESRRRQMPYDSYIRYQDEMILRRMLIGQKLFEGGGGVYGPKVPFDIILMRFEDFRLELTDALNQMLAFVAGLNWHLEIPPKLTFAPLTTMDMAAIRSTIMESIDKGIVSPDETWIRDELGFPLREVKNMMASLPGRFLAGKHAEWLASGYKKVIVGTKPYGKYRDQQIHIVGEDGIHGIMVEGEPEGPLTSRVREKYRNLHRISSSEWETWWSGSTQFWVWQPKIVKRFNPPLDYDIPEGVRVYIKRVVLDSNSNNMEEL